MLETRLTIPCDDITLEGVWHVPQGAGPFPAVVVCHPHPQYGGDMHNNVVAAIVRAVTGCGMAALRFNFRGVGRSGGQHDNGAGERDDVRAALRHAASLPGVAAARIGLAGYSFGAMMAAAVTGPSIPALALVALPLAIDASTRSAEGGTGDGPLARWPALAAYPSPVLLIAGDRDHVCPAAALRDLGAALPATAETHIVPGADHFWGGHEHELEQTVGAFFARHLGAAS
jgi:alpha/beta superfamily hydrolase